jgi:hypothetical protein
MQNSSVIEVFTGKSVQQMLEHGGSQSWVVNPQSMRNVTHCVCTRNDGRDGEDGFPTNPEPRHSAFLVGKVAGLRKVEHRNNRDRYLILFSEYAVVDPPIPNFRHGMTRNPVVYSDIDQCRQRGLDITALDFHPMPQISTAVSAPPPPAGQPAAKGLTISEAKEGLAIFHGVPVENVQITIIG